MNTVKAMNVNDAAAAKHYRWKEIPAEPMKGTITRKLITERAHDDCACVPQEGR